MKKSCIIFVVMFGWNSFVMNSNAQGLIQSGTGFYYPVNTRDLGGYYNFLDYNSEYAPYVYHLGADFKQNYGNNVYAIADGVVVAIQYGYGTTPTMVNGGYTGAIMIKHLKRDGTPFTAIYGHITVVKKVGDIVSAGTIIGNITQSNAYHLHFSIHEGADVSWGKGYTSNRAQTEGFVPPVAVNRTWVQDSGFIEKYAPADSTDYPMLQIFPQENRLYQAVRGDDNRIYTRSKTVGGEWSSWEVSGESLSSIQMATFNGKLYQTVRGTDNGVYTRFKSVNGNWSNWERSGDTLSAVNWKVFTLLYQVHRGDDNKIYLRSTSDGQNWSGWECSSGETIGAITMEGFEGKLWQVVRGSNNSIYTRSQTPNGNWSDWEQNGATLTDIQMQTFNNRLYQAARGLDNAIYTRYKTEGGTWTNWINNGSTLSTIQMKVFKDSLYQAVRGLNNDIYTRCTTDGNTWSSWINAGQSISAVGMEEFEGRLYQTVRGMDNVIYTRYTADGINWQSWEGAPSFPSVSVANTTFLSTGNRESEVVTDEFGSKEGIISPSPVPEPGTLVLLGLGLFGLIPMKRRVFSSRRK